MAKKKLACASCGMAVKRKMKTGGVAPKPFAAGIPYAAGAGQFDGKNGKMKKGGSVKKYAEGGPSIKSKKVRDVSLNTFGDSYAKTTKTKRDGSTVTKSIDTTRGYVPTASKTKTVTDKSGNVTTSTKSMNYNKAVRKQIGTVKKVGRNSEDYAQIDGTEKIFARGGSLKPVPSGNKGLSKLPTAVRNKMGYQKRGGAIKRK